MILMALLRISVQGFIQSRELSYRVGLEKLEQCNSRPDTTHCTTQTPRDYEHCVRPAHTKGDEGDG